MLGYGPEDKSTVLELTYNYGVTKYEKGSGYAQVYTFSICKCHDIVVMAMQQLLFLDANLCNPF